jgi:hypothetical protein
MTPAVQPSLLPGASSHLYCLENSIFRFIGIGSDNNFCSSGLFIFPPELEMKNLSFKSSWFAWPRAHHFPNRAAVALLIFVLLCSVDTFAATPAGGSISPASATLNWSGGPFLAPNPLTCFSLAGLDPTCDSFSLTITPPQQAFVVTIRISATRSGDDIDLFVNDPNGNTVAQSTTSGGVEEILLSNPAAGTYTVVVQPTLVIPPPAGAATYTGFAAIGSPSADLSAQSYHGALFTGNSVGVPSSTPSSSPLVPQLKVSFNYVGRQAAEPTIGVNRNNKAFFAASTFDFPTSTFPVTLAHTLVMASSDKGRTWTAASPPLVSNLPEDELNPTFPPFSLDPYVYVDPTGVNSSSRNGRIFSADLNAVCGANAIFSDDEGATWTEVPLFGCGVPVTDHQSILAAPVPAGGLPVVGYPKVVYFCYNQVGDSTCSRSNDGGLTWTTTANPAFTGTDPTSAGSVCGGLTGQLAADSQGRIFLPKGHCGLPWVAISADEGNTWTRVNITNLTPMADHEVSLAIDSADNVYAVWQDGTFRLPFFSVSTDHGLTWSGPLMIAPPGVHEVNFPTIAAGDPGRVAFLFPGSQSTNFSDQTRPWNVYLVASVNALDANPTFTWTTANPTSDPIHRGDCGPGRCGGMFDFLDIQVSPADGAFWGTASDTCVPNTDFSLDCVHNPQAPTISPGQGAAIREIKGPSLFTNHKK